MVSQISLEQAAAMQSHYTPNKNVREALKAKSLIMFVGPVATGKTFVMKNIVSANTSFGCVTSFTTRELRLDDDPAMFHYIPHDEIHISQLLDKISNGTAVQYAIHPTSHRIYGSEVQDYPNEYNMLATLSGVVEPMTKLPFKQVRTIGLVCTPTAWEAWLAKRFPLANSDKQRRIEEAVHSLTWLLAHDTLVTWVENSQDFPEKTTRAVLDAILYNKKDDKAKHLAYDMLKRAKELL